MVSADLQQGFKVLRDRNQLNNTFEALVVRFQHLFKPDVVRPHNGGPLMLMSFSDGLNAQAEPACARDTQRPHAHDTRRSATAENEE